MDEERTPLSPSDPIPLQGLASSLLSDPELMNRIKTLMQGTTPQASPEASPEATTDAPVSASSPLSSLFENGGADGLSALLANPALLEKLPQIMAMLKPILTAQSPQTSQNSALTKPTIVSDERDKLLLSLKPFLSRERQEAVDAILRIAKLGTILQQIK